MVDPALQELLDERLGSPEMQARADAASRRQVLEGKRAVPSDVAALVKRVSKIHLPMGKRLPRDDKPARDEFAARQVDLEDAVEAAGGRRGG